MTFSETCRCGACLVARPLNAEIARLSTENATLAATIERIRVIVDDPIAAFVKSRVRAVLEATS
jgi:hypothetical protein